MRNSTSSSDSEGVRGVGPGIGVERFPSVALVVLRNPRVRNALTMQMWSSLSSLIQELDADEDVRAIVIRGHGDHFSSGADIADLPDDAMVFHRAHLAAEMAIASALTPVIAAVSGYCVGGGCEIAVAADVRFADASARFGITASRLGVVYPEAPTRRLVELIGVGEARRMLLGGEIFDAIWARHVGLVHEVVPEGGDVVSRALAWADGLTRRSLDTITAAQRTTRGLATSPVGPSGDYREGKNAYLEQRHPHFAVTCGDDSTSHGRR